MEKKLTQDEKLRLSVFKTQLEQGFLPFFSDKNFSDRELIEIMDTCVLPNGTSFKSVKNSLLVYLFLYGGKTNRRKRIFEHIEAVMRFVKGLEYYERVILKYGILKGYKKNDIRGNFYNYLMKPINEFQREHTGRKVLSYKKFKEFFPLANSLITKIRKNRGINGFK